MFRKSKALIILAAAFLCFSFSFESAAAEYPVYDVVLDKPSSSDNSGYLEILYQTTDGFRFVTVFNWNLQGVISTDAEAQSYVGVNINSNGSLSFYANYCNYWYLQYFYSYSTNPAILHNGTTYTNNPITWNQPHKIVGYRAYGNVSVTATGFDIYSTEPFVVAYGIDANENALQEESNAIQEEQKELQNESNNWLEKIFDLIKGSPEEEKQAAQTQGQQSTTDVTNAVEDKSEGYISGINNLVSSMSHTGTECSWTFPAIKLPAIPGVMPSYTLSSEQTIDFSYWFNQLPADIVTIIRAVTSLCLYIYCFKELYGVISYVLTLRGGGSDE